MTRQDAINECVPINDHDLIAPEHEMSAPYLWLAGAETFEEATAIAAEVEHLLGDAAMPPRMWHCLSADLQAHRILWGLPAPASDSAGLSGIGGKGNDPNLSGAGALTAPPMDPSLGLDSIHKQWAKQGFNSLAAQQWVRAGFDDPHVARIWKDAGFTRAELAGRKFRLCDLPDGLTADIHAYYAERASDAVAAG